MTAHPWLGTGSTYGNAVSCTWERGGYVAYLANLKRYCNASEILRMPIPGYTDAEPTSQPVPQQHNGVIDDPYDDSFFQRPALCQPIVLKEYTMTVDAWHWLRNNQPESYAQLIEKLEQAKEILAPSGQIELRQMVKVFHWCGDHGIELTDLQIPDHLHKYREAAAYLNRISDSDETDQAKVRKMQETIDHIKSDPNRRATRTWARSWRGEKARGHQVVSGGEPVGLVVFGPSATIQRTRSAIERFVDWDLSIDDALSELHGAGRAEDSEN